MSNSVERLKTEVDDIKKSLKDLKNNVTFSETEKKTKAEALKKQADATKQKIQDTIKALENKTDDASKMEKEKATTLLTSFNDITVFYNSIINPTTNTGTQTPNLPSEEKKGLFTESKERIGTQWNSIRDKEKWDSEGGKNLLRTVGFAATGIGAISLAYKGIKKLFGIGEDEDTEGEKEEKGKKGKEKGENKGEEKENNEDKEERKEEKGKEGAKKGFWSKWYGKTIGGGIIGTGVYYLGKWLHFWGNKDEDESQNRNTQGEGASQNENTEKSSDSGNKEKESENNPTKKDSEEDTTKKDSEKSSESNESKQSKEGLDKENKTYTNPKSGLTYNRIDQVTDPAGKLKYGGKGKRKGKTVADTGCLLASGCTITSALCPSVTLKDCFNTVKHRNANDAVEKMSNKKWIGIPVLAKETPNRTHKECEEAKKKIEENLEKGYPAIIGARHRGIDGINNSIESQHYRAIVDMRTNNGKKEFFVANTYNGKTGGWKSEDSIFKNMIHASIFKPSAA